MENVKDSEENLTSDDINKRMILKNYDENPIDDEDFINYLNKSENMRKQKNKEQEDENENENKDENINENNDINEDDFLEQKSNKDIEGNGNDEVYNFPVVKTIKFKKEKAEKDPPGPQGRFRSGGAGRLLPRIEA